MLRRIPRFLRVSVLVAVLLAVSVSVFQSWSSSSPGTAGWVQTQWGPLGPADRDLLVKVRLAGLWEGPTGQQAMQQAGTAEVREIGRILSTEHATLDVEVRTVANQLGVLLPTSPSTQQLLWMDEISAQTGSDYDRLFIQRLREAHGMVLPAIAEVRASTRNELVRSFTAVAERFVSGHIEHLEGSGLVDYAALPEAPSPGLLSGEPSTGDLIVPILVFVAALLGAFALIASVRSRNRPRRVVPAAAAAPALVAIPGPRQASDDDTGPIPVIRTSGADTGSHRVVEAGADTGSHRVVEPGGDTGSRRARSRGRTAPGETTGPRHAVRR